MNYKEAIRKLEQLKTQIATITGNEMVNFALDNIRAGSWEGQRWQPRDAKARRNAGRALLVDTGRGRRSIDDKITGDQVKLVAEEYMVAHNEGVKKTVSVRGGKRKAHTRHMNLPQRQFTGESDRQTERINKIIANRIVQSLT